MVQRVAQREDNYNHINMIKKKTSLLEEYVRLILTEKKRRKQRDPGGPRTDLGALRQLHPDEFRTKVQDAVAAAEGDVEKAAETLGVAKRTLYYYLSDETALNRVKTSSELRESNDNTYYVDMYGEMPCPECGEMFLPRATTDGIALDLKCPTCEEERSNDY